ncbi:MAG: membrane protein insertion efficiency factor YidD [Propionibacteriaceae bacterium]
MKYLLIGLVRIWRRIISPLYGDVCKFHPSCSAYGLRALEFHGAIKGSWLTVNRIGRCHPWAAGGVDYVPGTPEAEQWLASEAEASSTKGPVGSAASGVKE